LKAPATRPYPGSATLAIAQTTYRQLMRDPAVLLVAAGGLLLIVTAPAYAVFHFDELAKVMIDTGLSTALLAGLLIALMGPARAVAYELEDRTALTLLSKPVSRLGLVLGKYLGVLCAVFVVLFPLVIAVLYVVRITGVLDEARASAAVLPVVGSVPAELAPLLVVAAVALPVAALAALLVRRARAVAAYVVIVTAAAVGIFAAGPVSDWRWSIAGAGLLLTMEVAVVGAVALAAAVRFGAVGTFVAGLAVLVAGHLRSLAGPNPLDGGVFGLVQGVLPGLEALNALEAAAAGAPVPGLYVASAAVYATMYAGAAILIGAASIQAREVA
jgi:hypothetical protein